MPIFSQFGEIVWHRLFNIARILQTTALNKARYWRLHWKLASVPVNAMLLWFYSDNQIFPKLRYQNDPTWCCVRWCWHNQQQSSKVWRHKKFNLWNYGICQDILKEQHPTFTPKCGPSPSRYSVSNNFLIPLTEEKQKEKESSSETKLPLIKLPFPLM